MDTLCFWTAIRGSLFIYRNRLFIIKFDILNQNFLLPCALAALCQLSGTAFLILLFRLRNFAIGSTYVRTEVLIAAFIGTFFFDEFVSPMGWVAIFISVSGVIIISVVKFNTGTRNSLKNFLMFRLGLVC